MSGNEPKYQFYERVRISSKDPELTEVDGELGAVLGKSQNQAGSWFYTVFVYRTSICWVLPQGELERTGEFDRRETFFDGASLNVQVDEEGHGELSEE